MWHDAEQHVTRQASNARAAAKLRRAPGTALPTVRESKPPSRSATTTPAAMSVSTDEENPSVQAEHVRVEAFEVVNHAAVLAELALYREEAERLRPGDPCPDFLLPRCVDVAHSC